MTQQELDNLYEKYYLQHYKKNTSPNQKKKSIYVLIGETIKYFEQYKDHDEFDVISKDCLANAMILYQFKFAHKRYDTAFEQLDSIFEDRDFIDLRRYKKSPFARENISKYIDVFRKISMNQL